MRHKLFICTLIIISSYFISCKTIQLSDLHPTGSLNQLLPRMEPQIDMNSFQANYGLSTIYNYNNTNTNNQHDSDYPYNYNANQSYYSTRIIDKRLQDAIVICEREIKNNITSNTGKALGHINIKIPACETSIRGVPLYVLSCMLLSIPNWFGMPSMLYRTELEIELEITDCNNNIIGFYQSYGSKTIPVAAWHGYRGGGFVLTGSEPAARKSNIEAIKIAMKDIKLKIEKDYQKIIEQLEHCK